MSLRSWIDFFIIASAEYLIISDKICVCVMFEFADIIHQNVSDNSAKFHLGCANLCGISPFPTTAALGIACFVTKIVFASKILN